MVVRNIRAVFTGDRKWTNEFPVWIHLGQLFFFCKNTKRKFVLICGLADGLDTIVDDWAKRYAHDKTLRYYPMAADWEKYGRPAGPIRNKDMLKRLLKGNEEDERYVFGFHNNIKESKGTKNMLTIAKKAGIPTFLTGEY